MHGADVNFLERYLDLHPELKGCIGTDPPRLQMGKEVRRVVRVRPLRAGIELILANGQCVRFLPEEGRDSERKQFRDSFLGLLRYHFPHLKIQKILSGTDRNRHQTAALLRLLLSDGRHYLAAVVAPVEDAEIADRLLTSSALWWDRLQREGCAERVLVFIPSSWSKRILNTLSRVTIPVSCYEYRLSGGDAASSVRKIYPSSTKISTVKNPYVIFPYQKRVPEVFERLQRDFPFLQLSFRHGRWALSFRGLEIARDDENLGQCAFERFRERLRKLTYLRSFPPPEPDHPYYRLAQERWLESLIISDHTILNDDFVDVIYSQVPTYLDGERKVLDLLTASRSGRVAVLELKVEKDLTLLFQAVEYWERVGYHLKHGDFQRAGYFPGMKLSQKAPVLYLISPLFDFHKAMPVLRKYLDQRLTVKCIGVNSDWRRELKILRRFKF